MIRLVHTGSSTPLLADIERVCAAIASQSTIELQTSGTTGSPRRHSHSLDSAVRRQHNGQPSDRYLLTFSPTRWAGVSVIVHCHQIGCELVVPRSLDPGEIAVACTAHAPSHISLTPTLLRLLLLRDVQATLARTPLRQITFGGECASQSILDLTRATWPSARITHTYASTEHGDICAVSDGLAGFPAKKFAPFAFADGSTEGELLIDGQPTGDCWRLVGDRYHFVGRVGDLINVGGNKVSPLLVEEAALRSGARLARALAVPNPLTGQLVALEYVGSIEPQLLRRNMSRHLPKFAWPAHIVRLDALPMNAAGKLLRQS